MSLQFEPQFFKVEKMEADLPRGTIIKKSFNLFDSDDEDVKTEIKSSPPIIKTSNSPQNFTTNYDYKKEQKYKFKTCAEKRLFLQNFHGCVKNILVLT